MEHQEKHPKDKVVAHRLKYAKPGIAERFIDDEVLLVPSKTKSNATDSPNPNKLPPSKRGRIAKSDAELEIQAKLGSAIRKLRLEQGMSQDKLAELADLTRSYTTDLERGLHGVGIFLAHRVANALGIPLSKLLEEAGL